MLPPAFATVFALTASLSLSRAAEIVLAATAPEISYAPPPGGGSWTPIKAPGALNGGDGAFLLGQNDKGKIQITPTVAFTGIQYFGWDRSDGARYSVTIDGVKNKDINAFDPKSGPDATPHLLFKQDGLRDVKHTVVITNLNDTSPGSRGFGQMNLDHIVLITSGAAPPPPATLPPPPAVTPPPAAAPPPPAAPPPLTPPGTASQPNVPQSTGPPVANGGDQQNLAPPENKDGAASSLQMAPIAALLGAAAFAVFAL